MVALQAVCTDLLGRPGLMGRLHPAFQHQDNLSAQGFSALLRTHLIKAPLPPLSISGAQL